MPTTTDIKPLTEQTPAEIDTVLFPLWAERYSLAESIPVLQDRVDYYTGLATSSGYCRLLGSAHERLVEAENTLAQVQVAIAHLEAEYDRRGGWSRYYLVCNTGGHLHTSRDCSSCYPSTQFALVAQSSGLDAEQLIETFAEVVCSVCFPDAPSTPAYARGIALAKAERERIFCAGGGEYIGYGKSYGTCPVCSEVVSTTGRNGVIRKHKHADVIEAELLADPKKLPKSLVFKGVDGYRVDKVAACKTALRDAAKALVLRDSYYRNTYGPQAEKAPEVIQAATKALLAKGAATQVEIDTILAKATKAAAKNAY